jgi:HAD superfamily hydrolase (TIGR01509 family)
VARSGHGAVIFDVDGTLVDSNYLHVVAWMAAFRDVGCPVDAAAIHRAIGMGSEQLLVALLGAEDADRVGEQAKERHREHYRPNLETLRAFDGANGLLRRVSDGAEVVLATSAEPDEISAQRRALNADDVISAVIGSSDVESAKPQPDLVEVALQKVGVTTDRAVFVGDTVWDVEAASRAGVRCVGVVTGGICAAELRDAGAVAVYGGASDLLAHLNESHLWAVMH